MSRGEPTLRLTGRERQVAELVAAGHTNKEIADRLFVSERTAEYHVEQIRNKLGFHSRREIASWMRAAQAGRQPAVVDASPEHPPTRYARKNEVNIAFQTFGSGSLDLIVVPGWVSHLEHMWRHPSFAAYLDRLARFARLILFDKRGTGMSDRVPVGTLEDRTEDIRAVMDALGISRAAIYGISEGGPLALYFAAAHPERVSALVVYASFPRMVAAPDYRIGVPVDAWLERTEFTERNWPVVDLERWAPSVANDERFRQWLGEVRRYGASPGAARELMEVIGAIDVRAVLPAIRVPTLVLHRQGDATISPEMGRVIAEGIASARWVELPGDDHLPWTGDVERLAVEIEDFLTGRHAGQAVDRMLAAILACQVVELPRERPLALPDLAASEVIRLGGRMTSASPTRFLAMFQGPGRAVECAQAVVASVREAGASVRTGIHVGECEPTDAGLRGHTVDIAQLVSERADPDEILVSGAVRDLLAGSVLAFRERDALINGDDLARLRLYAIEPAARRTA